ncbi:hypothetical protein GCM10020255_029170 [Rhodococcus baikonurensis]
MLTAIGMTEPSGGSDLASLKTTAVKDGDDWIINGSKTFITNGYNADLVIVAARTSPEKKSKGITLFAVETGMEGFERGRKLDKVGQHESDTAELFFENVRVPSTNIIGEIDRGFIHMMEMLPQSASALRCPTSRTLLRSSKRRCNMPRTARLSVSRSARCSGTNSFSRIS